MPHHSNGFVAAVFINFEMSLLIRVGSYFSFFIMKSKLTKGFISEYEEDICFSKKTEKSQKMFMEEIRADYCVSGKYEVG